MEEHNIDCPYCGEQLGILLDYSVPEQHYVEDCQVCCCPIVIQVVINHDGELEQLTAIQEND